MLGYDRYNHPDRLPERPRSAALRRRAALPLLAVGDVTLRQVAAAWYDNDTAAAKAELYPHLREKEPAHDRRGPPDERC